MTTTPIHLDARSDPRVAEYRDVAEPELVRQRGLFVAEGRLVVRRLIEDARFPIRSVLLSEAAFAQLQPALDRLAPSVPVYVSRAESLSDLVGYNVHRGCLALAVRPEPLAHTLLLEKATTVVVAENIADPSNLGGIFRNALAFGAGAVMLSPGACDPLYRKAVRTSMGATLRVPFARLSAWPRDLADLTTRGFLLVALTPRQPSLTLEEFTAAEDLLAGKITRKVALMVGTEGSGLSSDAIAAADVRVRIPIAPESDSVNVAVASGIALYRLAAARRNASVPADVSSPSGS